MAFNDQITRVNAGPLIPEDVSREIIQSVPEQSAVMRMARRMPDMPRAQRRMPVQSVLPTAFFVTGDTGLKQTTSMEWENKFFDAEEIACIVPISEAVLDDVDYDIWAEARPRIAEAFGRVFDAAVLFGTNAPASWPDDLLTAATAAGNTVTLGAGADLYDDLLAPGGMRDKVTLDGYPVTGWMAALEMQARLDGLRDANGQPIFAPSMQDPTRWVLRGSNIDFPMNGAFDPLQALMFAGDWRQLVWCMRTDLTARLLDQAVIQDGSGDIILNLAQMDMVAMRFVMRLAWQVPNPINRINENDTTRFPFSVLLPS